MERELTGEDSEPWELFYFKLYKGQLAIIDQALETTGPHAKGNDRSRGYCLGMIWADFLAGANLDNGDPETLLFSMQGFFRFSSDDRKREFVKGLNEITA